MAKKKHSEGVNGASKAIQKAVGGGIEKKKVAIRTDIPIDHVFPEGQQAIYSNQFAVQHENGVYHLMFFQIHPPLALGNHEEKSQKLREIKTVQAPCVARILIAGEMLPKIIEVLIDNLKTQQALISNQVDLVDVSSSSPKNRKELT